MGAQRLDRACRRGHPRTPENVYVKPDGFRQCRPCSALLMRRWRQEHRALDRELRRRSRLWTHYRLTPEDWDAILASQGGACAICGTTGRLQADHDHRCCPGEQTCGDCVRGILCQPCNAALGTCKEDPSRAKSGRFTDPWLAAMATAYVESFRARLEGVA